MARSIKKGPFVDYHLIEKIERMNESGKKAPIKTWSRRSMVIPDFVGHTFHVYERYGRYPSAHRAILAHDVEQFVDVDDDGRFDGEI